MFRWIAENYRTFLWALALAIAVWIAAVSAADPDETRVLRPMVALELIGQDPGVVVSSDLPASVSLTLHAPRSVWDVIAAEPQSVRALLDLSGLDAGVYTREIQIQIHARPVQIVSMSPRTVNLVIENLASKTLPLDVQLLGETAIGYQAGDLKVEPSEIVLSGAESQVEQARSAHVSLNINGARENIEKLISVELLDENGEPLSGVSFSPETARVTLPIIQQGGYRDVAVKVVTNGRIASGYRMTDLSVFPPVVTVYSEDPQIVANLPGVVETQALDLSGAQDDITTRLLLSLPPGVSIIGEQAVLIQVGISPIESSVTLAGEKIEVTGLLPGLAAQVSPAVIDVIVSGPLPVLDTLSRQDVRVIVDLSELSVGIYQLTPRVESLVSEVVVESILPNTAEVVITQGVTPTP